jgi:hypothetical protein
VTTWLVCFILSQPEPALVHCGTAADPALRELSGLVRASRDPALFWAHGDSGNAPALFALDAGGHVARRVDLAAPNIDWEDIATDDQGHLFVGDIGNNGDALPLRFIYEIDEPALPGPAGPERLLKPRRVYHVAFPARPFDAEALFVLDGSLVVVRKRLDGRDATLHAIPLSHPGSPLRPARWREIATLKGFTEPATGADLSPDRRWLAVCGASVTRLYEKTATGWRPAASVRYRPRSIEAVAWDESDVLLADEQGNILRWRRPLETSAGALGSN